MSGILTKALSPAYYKAQWSNFLVKSYNYYHPMMQKGE